MTASATWVMTGHGMATRLRHSTDRVTGTGRNRRSAGSERPSRGHRASRSSEEHRVVADDSGSRRPATLIGGAIRRDLARRTGAVVGTLSSWREASRRIAWTNTRTRCCATCSCRMRARRQSGKSLPRIRPHGHAGQEGRTAPRRRRCARAAAGNGKRPGNPLLRGTDSPVGAVSRCHVLFPVGRDMGTLL